MRSVTKQSLLYKSNVEYADFCINHVVGCSHGCNFPCYAMKMAIRFGQVKNRMDWLKPKIVSNTLELLDKEIPRYKDKIKFVHLCFMTDPFMYGNRDVRNLTLKIIKKLNINGIKCTALTKGILPKALDDKKKYGKDNEYGITLVSLDNGFKKDFEPFSSPYSRRIEALKHLHKKGLKTWVSMEPYPTPNLAKKQDLLAMLKKVSFVDRIIFGKLNYNTTSTRFKDNAKFYKESAKTVVDFCKNKNIDFHIKFGTQKKYNKKTEGLFCS